MKKNVASQVIGAQMVSASDGSAFTGAVTVYVTGDGGTQAVGSVGSGACTHEGNGYHTYAPAQAETNYDQIAFTFTGTGAIPATIQVYTNYPQTGDSYTRLGAPAGASVSADIATIDGNVDAILVDTGTSGVIVATNNDKTGYSLTQSFPANFADLAITVTTGKVTVGTNDDKTGYALTQTFPANFADLSISATTGLVDITQTAADKAWSTTTRVLTANTNLNDPTAAAIADAVWDESTVGHTTAGTFGEQVKTDIDAVLADTNELQTDWANGGRLDVILDARASQTTADAIEADTQDIQSRLPAALVGGRMDSNVSAIGNDTGTLSQFKRNVDGSVICTVGVGSSSTSIVTSACSPAGVNTDQFRGKIVTFDKNTTTTALRGQSTDITASTAASLPVLTVSTMVATPASGDTFTIT